MMLGLSCSERGDLCFGLVSHIEVVVGLGCSGGPDIRLKDDITLKVWLNKAVFELSQYIQQFLASN